MMAQESLIVTERSSTLGQLGGLVLSARSTNSIMVELVVGRPGMPNVEQELRVGDAILFETPDTGVLEVRVLATMPSQAKLLVSQVSPRPGITGGFVDEDTNNSPFMPSELAQVRDSLESIKFAMGQRPDVAPEQLALISRKLDEIQAASERLGRKDWINSVIGILTNLTVAAAFNSDIRTALFRAAGKALSWLLNDGLRLLP